MNWTSEQQTIFDHVKTGRRSFVVRARAGTGKTSTISEALKHAGERDILLVAFNKIIAMEMRKRVTNPAVRAQTLHALGLKFITQNWPVAVDEDGQRAERLVVQEFGDTLPKALISLVKQLHTRAREVMPFAGTPEEIIHLAAVADLLPDEEWDARGWSLERIAEGVLHILDHAKAPTATIDFADMIFLPLVNDWVQPVASLVFVDEAQDMSAPQLDIAVRAVQDTGRLVLVGDNRQAIYGFRGADTEGLDRLKKELDADEVGLTVTFRCPRRVVERAKAYVPDYRAMEGAPDGIVRVVPVINDETPFEPGAFVLSRTNAPLVGTCLSLIRRGVPACVRGRDIGKGLKAKIQKLYAPDVETFLEKVNLWEVKEKMRAIRCGLGGFTRARIVADTAATLHALADGAVTTDDLVRRVDSLFSDDASSRAVVCSTVHKAKGLESKQVWVLDDTFKWEGQEEDNLRYVAITRSKQELVVVSSKVEA